MPRRRKSEQDASAGRPWPVWARALVSLVLVVHLAAVFFPPFTFQTSPVAAGRSPFAASVMNLLAPYIDFAYLNHGYAFFAPNPGPSHLLRAKIEFDDGRPAIEETLPDLERHWPRLLYHRHFMLSEHLHASFVPPQPPPEIAADPREMEFWRQGRQLYLDRRAAMERHLQVKYGADRVTLTRIEHRLLGPLEVTQLGRRIDAPETYVELSEDAWPEEMP